MPDSLERLREAMTAMDARLTAADARADKNHDLHLLECGARYATLLRTVNQYGIWTRYGMILLLVVAVGLKTKFAEPILRVLGLL